MNEIELIDPLNPLISFEYSNEYHNYLYSQNDLKNSVENWNNFISMNVINIPLPNDNIRAKIIEEYIFRLINHGKEFKFDEIKMKYFIQISINLWNKCCLRNPNIYKEDAIELTKREILDITIQNTESKFSITDISKLSTYLSSTFLQGLLALQFLFKNNPIEYIVKKELIIETPYKVIPLSLGEEIVEKTNENLEIIGNSI